MNKIIKCCLVLFSCAVLALTSCKTKHDLAMFEDLADSQAGVLTTQSHTNKIEPEMELVIIVKSEAPAATAQFNLPYYNPATAGTTAAQQTPLMQTYLVDNKGDIDFPVLGTIHVAGMTVYELKDYLTHRISEYVKDPVVTVKGGGYRIVVLGEVNKPQTFYTSQDRFSVLDALAACGDLTEFARRDNILVMRRLDNGTIEYGRLDLHNSNITQSPYFWLENNDVVIIEPNNIKQDNSKFNQNNSYKLSVASTIVGVASVIASLVIALTVK